MDQDPNTQNSTSDESAFTLNKTERDQHKVFIAITAVLGLILLILLIIKGSGGLTTDNPTSVTDPASYSEARRLSTSGEDPEALQNFLVEKIQAGANDTETRSAIYWITHRYFDNGGNIYEIYDFVETHPEVNFLKKAEGIYPEVFAKVKDRSVTSYSRESLLALLAYYQVIDYSGYANIAIWGLAANKYSEQAIMNLPNPEDTPEIAQERERYFGDMLRNAQRFAARSEDYIINNTFKTGALEDLYETDVEVNDLLVGLNQHASALANLEGLGYREPSAFTITELFEHNSEFSLAEVPRLYFFTNYLYATALLQTKRATPEEVAVPLKRVVEYARANTDWRPGGSIERVISSKNIRESSLFSYEYAKELASMNGDFKVWLMENGWDEKDF